MSGSETHRSRRDFLRRAAGSVAAAAMLRPEGLFSDALGSCFALGDAADGDADRGDPRHGSIHSDRGEARSRVVQVVDRQILPVRIVQRSLVREYLNEGLLLLTGENTPADAWHQILDDEDIVLIKFNRSAARRLGTTPAMAAEVVESLVRAGWNSERLLLLEAGDGLPRIPKTRRPDSRWQGEVVSFGRSGSDSFIAALDQATAIINIPFLKTHHRATMTCCLKNLSHGLIRHPARFHADGCDPAIGEITASVQIQSKLKLNIVNGLRVVFDRGPEARDEDMESAGCLLLGRDPVACDAIGYGFLNEIRSIRGRPPLLPDVRVPKQLRTAAGLGVGRFDIETIDLQKLP